MLSFLFSLLFSKVLTLGGPALLVIGAAAAAWFGFKQIARLLLIAAAVWFSLALMYREGVKAENARWTEEVRIEQQRQAEARAQIHADAETQRLASERENDALKAQLSEIEAEYARLEAAEAAEDAADAARPSAPVTAGKPPACPPVRARACRLTPDEASRLESIR